MYVFVVNVLDVCIFVMVYGDTFIVLLCLAVFCLCPPTPPVCPTLKLPTAQWVTIKINMSKAKFTACKLHLIKSLLFTPF